MTDRLLTQTELAQQMRATAARRKEFAMTGEQFAEALAKLNLHPRVFAQILAKNGHTATDPERSVRRWIGEKPSPEAVVIVRLLGKLRLLAKQSATLRKNSSHRRKKALTS